MKELNDLVELAKRANTAGQGTPEMADFRVTASPDNILAIAEAFRALEQREEAAEASTKEWRRKAMNQCAKREVAESKLAELQKQEPVGSFHIHEGSVEATTDYLADGDWPVRNGEVMVYARPAPAVSLAELVLDENDNPEGFISWYERQFAGQAYKGSSHVADCEEAWRAAILRYIEEQSQ